MKPHTKNELLRLNKDGSTPKRERRSTIGPGHDGAAKPGFYDSTGNGLMSHPGSVPAVARPGETSEHRRATLGVPPKIKRSYTDPVPIHSGMATQTKNSGIAWGAGHRDYLDALTGDSVVPGQIKSTPGFGNAGVQDGHPFATPPQSKRLTKPEIKPGMRSRVGETYNAEPGGYHAVGQINRERARDLLHLTGDAVIEEGIAMDSQHPTNMARNMGRKR